MAVLTHRVVPFSPAETPIDDLVPALNPVRAADLCTILALVPAAHRRAVALAFAGLTQNEWAALAGIDAPTVSRWLTGEHKLPFGAALRLAKVLGIAADLLFEGWA